MTAVWAAMDVIKREPISGLDVSVEHVIGLFDGIAGIANTQVLSGLGMSPVAINAHNMERLYNPCRFLFHLSEHSLNEALIALNMPCGLIDHQPIPLVLTHHQKSIVPRYNSGDSDVRRPTHGVPLRFESEVLKIMPENKLTHIDETGSATMVSVVGKRSTERTAVAAGSVIMKSDTLEMIKEATHKKGDVLTVAKIAGIQAAKQCSHLIPLCHPINLASVDLAFSLDPEQAKVDITASCTVTDATGVEMEALTAVSVAALTIYDMCKAVDKQMQLTNIRLTKKTGGRSGDFEAP